MLEYAQKNTSFIQFSIFYWSNLHDKMELYPTSFNLQKCKNWPFGKLVFQLKPMFQQSLMSKKNIEFDAKQLTNSVTNVAIDFDFEHNRRFIFLTNFFKFKNIFILVLKEIALELLKIGIFVVINLL